MFEKASGAKKASTLSKDTGTLTRLDGEATVVVSRTMVASGRWTHPEVASELVGEALTKDYGALTKLFEKASRAMEESTHSKDNGSLTKLDERAPVVKSRAMEASG